MKYRITPVQGPRDLDAFLDLPYRIYRDDPNMVYPLKGELKHFFDRKKNPFFRHAAAELWLARDKQDQVVGRIAAAVDRYNNEHHQEKVGFFGFYEAEDDMDLARLLLEQARRWIAEQGQETMRGPGCFTSNHDWFGLQVEGAFTRPVVGMPYNPPYYARHFDAYGLRKAQDLWAWHIETGGQLPEKMQRLIERVMARPGLRIRNFDMKNFEREASLIRGLYNECWSENWGFIPMDDLDFAYSAKDMKSMVDPAYLLVAEMEGRPIGFSLTIPDFNQATQGMKGKMLPFGWLKFLLAKGRIDYARTVLMGVLPQYRKLGVDMAMVYRTMQASFANGITRGECSWILEDNTSMNRILQGYGARKYKTYRIYEMPVA
ncbi:N-acetyltransferase [bacterium DOLJORAL78_65_58]|nr:MAG: N-acetyltransferase [bacterium DOLZORAL124_64_63]PIE75784.1 MAG: N-acetyltransferase [bacterium DOLJORAL78_65_58]